MGFRNPARTASAVNTGGVAAGVRIYQDATDDWGRTAGVLEFNDGAANDTPATITQGSVPVPRSVTDTYGRLTITGGSYATDGSGGAIMAAPTLRLGVEQKSPDDGTPTPRARISQPFDAIDSAAATLVAPFRNYPAAGLERLTVWQLASGLFFMSGVVQNSAAASASGVMATVPARFTPPGASPILFGYIGGNAICRLDLRGDGSLSLTDPALSASNFIAVRAMWRNDSTTF
jgi:hypothetical protein